MQEIRRRSAGEDPFGLGKIAHICLDFEATVKLKTSTT